MELNWGVGGGLESGVGGGEASIVNDPGVQWEMGGWQSDQAFCSLLLSVHFRIPKTSTVPSLGTPDQKRVK